MRSHSQFLISATKPTLTERDASCMLSKLPCLSVIKQHQNYWSQKYMPRFNLPASTQKWLFFQETRSKLVWPHLTPTKKPLDFLQKSTAQPCLHQLRRDINWATVLPDSHVTIERLQTLSNVKISLFIAPKQIRESAFQFKAQEMSTELTKHALNSWPTAKTGLECKMTSIPTLISSLKPSLMTRLERPWKSSPWTMLNSKTSLMLCNKRKDGSSSHTTSGGECTQMNQDAMPVFTWPHQLQLANYNAQAKNAT